jgi:predicted Zn-ribbon and HTH transcriptional regulator
MKIDILKIASAFVTKMSPTESQKELAEKRLEICGGCEFRKGEIDSSITRCKQCGCLIHAKIFSQSYSECPENKWSEVDKPYFNISEKKTLI